MPIYEYACPQCRKVFSFFSKTLTPPRQPDCPQCGLANLEKVLSRFSAPRGVQEPSGKAEGEEPMLSAADEARMEAVMGELERDMDHIDENNPKHLAYMMKRMKTDIFANGLHSAWLAMTTWTFPASSALPSAWWCSPWMSWARKPHACFCAAWPATGTIIPPFAVSVPSCSSLKSLRFPFPGFVVFVPSFSRLQIRGSFFNL